MQNKSLVQSGLNYLSNIKEMIVRLDQKLFLSLFVHTLVVESTLVRALQHISGIKYSIYVYYESPLQ